MVVSKRIFFVVNDGFFSFFRTTPSRASVFVVDVTQQKKVMRREEHCAGAAGCHGAPVHRPFADGGEAVSVFHVAASHEAGSLLPVPRFTLYTLRFEIKPPSP